METVKMVLQLLKNELVLLGLSGIAGAIAVAMVEWEGWFQLFRKITVGGLCAIYLSPLAVPLLSFFLDGLNVEAGHAPTLGGFIMGMIGIVLVEFIIHVFRTHSKIVMREKARQKPNHEVNSDDA